MIALKREIISTESYENETYFAYKCQASINSDGKITLRNYAIDNREKDEIIILSETETAAIFDLMYKIHEKTDRNDLPF